jgi:aerobic-type carbon monoxide dehydrogenase small subunit (CoxS/CutS family)
MSKLDANGERVDAHVDGSTLPTWVLRERLEVTATTCACGIGNRGS